MRSPHELAIDQAAAETVAGITGSVTRRWGPARAGRILVLALAWDVPATMEGSAWLGKASSSRSGLG
jgi:hypothetical protein